MKNTPKRLRQYRSTGIYTEVDSKIGLSRRRKPNFESTSVYLRILFCIFIAGITAYAYIDKQNELTELRLAIPALAKDVKSIQEENNRLRYEIEQFESPIHLMELMRKPEFSHLKYPYAKDVIYLPMGEPLEGGKFSDNLLNDSQE